MAFKVTNSTTDTTMKVCNIVAIDQATTPGTQSKMVQVNFPFDPPRIEGKERDAQIAAAKEVLRQALNEIS
jgi:hypothetical protein